MDKRCAQARRERHARERAEHAAQLAALRQIRDNPQATPGERLEAVKLLLELENKGYQYMCAPGPFLPSLCAKCAPKEVLDF